MSNTIITAHITDSTIQLANTPLLASGSVDVVQIQCDFCDKWEGYSKTAVFYVREDAVLHKLIVNGLVTIPHEMLAEEGGFYFGIMGVAENTRTTEVLKLKVVKGALTVPTAEPGEIEPSIYKELLRAYGVMESRMDQVVAPRTMEGSSVFTMTAENLEGTITTNGAAAFVECLPTFQLAAGEYADFYIPSYLAPMVPVEIPYANNDITVTVRVESSSGRPILSFYNGGQTSIKLENIPAMGAYSLASLIISELADVRVGLNGTVYASAGSAVRGQIAELYVQTGAVIPNPSTGGGGEVFYVTATVPNTNDAAVIRGFSINSTLMAIQEAALADFMPVILRFPYRHVNGNAQYCHLALVTTNSGSCSFSGVVHKDDSTAEIITAYIEGDDDYSIAVRHPVGNTRVETSGYVELIAANWVYDGSKYSQVVTVTNEDGVTPLAVANKSQVDLTPNVDQLVAFYNKSVMFVAQNENGVVVVYAIGQKPENDYTVQVTITEVVV